MAVHPNRVDPNAYLYFYNNTLASKTIEEMGYLESITAQLGIGQYRLEKVKELYRNAILHSDLEENKESKLRNIRILNNKIEAHNRAINNAGILYFLFIKIFFIKNIAYINTTIFWTNTPFANTRKNALGRNPHVDQHSAHHLARTLQLSPYFLSNGYLSYSKSLVKALDDPHIHLYLKEDQETYLKGVTFIRPFLEEDIIQNELFYFSDWINSQMRDRGMEILRYVITMQLSKILIFNKYKQGAIEKNKAENLIKLINNSIIKNSMFLFKNLDSIEMQIESMDKELGNYNSKLFNDKREALRDLHFFTAKISRCKGLIFQDLRNLLEPYFYYHVGKENKERPLWLCDQDVLIHLHLSAKKMIHNIDTHGSIQRLQVLNLRLTDIGTTAKAKKAAQDLLEFTLNSMRILNRNPFDSKFFLPKYFHMTDTADKFYTLGSAGIAMECNVVGAKLQSGAFGSTLPEGNQYGYFGIAMGSDFEYQGNTPNALKRFTNYQGDWEKNWLAFQDAPERIFPFFEASKINDEEKNYLTRQLGVKDYYKAMVLLSLFRQIYFGDIRPHAWQLLSAWQCYDRKKTDTYGQRYIYTEIKQAKKKSALNRKAPFSHLSANTIRWQKAVVLQRYNPTASLATNILNHTYRSNKKQKFQAQL